MSVCRLAPVGGGGSPVAPLIACQAGSFMERQHRLQSLSMEASATAHQCNVSFVMRNSAAAQIGALLGACVPHAGNCCACKAAFPRLRFLVALPEMGKCWSSHAANSQSSTHCTELAQCQGAINAAAWVDVVFWDAPPWSVGLAHTDTDLNAQARVHMYSAVKKP